MNAPIGTQPRTTSKAKKESIESTAALVLSQLKYPLVFFGLGLIVVETVFGIALNRALTQTSILVIVGCMTGLFIASIAIVGLLVWKVPTHIMLTAQTYASDDVLEQLRRARNAAQVLERWRQQPKTPDTLIEAIEAIELMLKGKTPSSEVEHV
jgi:hypothetical protein